MFSLPGPMVLLQAQRRAGAGTVERRVEPDSEGSTQGGPDILFGRALKRANERPSLHNWRAGRRSPARRRDSFATVAVAGRRGERGEATFVPFADVARSPWSSFVLFLRYVLSMSHATESLRLQKRRREKRNGQEGENEGKVGEGKNQIRLLIWYQNGFKRRE